MTNYYDHACFFPGTRIHRHGTQNILTVSSIICDDRRELLIPYCDTLHVPNDVYQNSFNIKLWLKYNLKII